MPYRTVNLVNNQIYHIFNRGVAKLPTFDDDRDYNRFLRSVFYYQFKGPKPRFSDNHKFQSLNVEKNPQIVEIIAYCLMPNHFHLLLKQMEEGGITEFMGKLANSYTKYFNNRHDRVGPLFQGEFKSVLIEDDEQLVHVSRYIHLNPVTSYMVENPRDYIFSSYRDYLNPHIKTFVKREEVFSHFKSPKEYEQFVLDQITYARTTKKIEHQFLKSL